MENSNQRRGLSPAIYVRLRPEDRVVLVREAARRGLTLSAMIRMAVAEWASSNAGKHAQDA